MTFSRIYQRNAWNGTETRSGPGSGSAATARLRRHLLELVAELGVTSVTDAACGEGFWQPDLPGYVGLDVAPEALAVAQERHPEREYQLRDLVRQGLPGAADLVLCRDAMQHMSLRDGQAILAAIRASESTWLLASTYVGMANKQVPTGGFYCPNLEAPPFDLPPAERLYHDGYDYSEGTSLRDPVKMLGLWRL